MEITKSSKPELIQLFENLLWAHAPDDWILKGLYYQGTLFVSMLVEVSFHEPRQTIRRSFDRDMIQSRSADLWGLAMDCVDEMKTEVNSS